jgi:hypothetical protein
VATIQVPIPLYVGDSSGNAYAAFYDANPQRYLIPAFLKDVAGYWYGHVRVPQDYANTPKIILSIGANATSGVSRLAVSSYAIADAESYDSTYTTETAQDIICRIDHEGAHANDTLAVDTLMFNCVFQYANA